LRPVKDAPIISFRRIFPRCFRWSFCPCFDRFSSVFHGKGSVPQDSLRLSAFCFGETFQEGPHSRRAVFPCGDQDIGARLAADNAPPIEMRDGCYKLTVFGFFFGEFLIGLFLFAEFQVGA
jgi:hypothetical protein